jgi:phage terminase small subunit
MPLLVATRDERDERFCWAYAQTLKGSVAARVAGIPDPSSRSWACRALQRPEIIARIEEIKAEIRTDLKVEAKEVARRWMQIATVDANELVEFRRRCCHHCWGQDFGYQRTDGAFRAARARHGIEVKKMQQAGRDLVEEIPEFDPMGGPGFDASRDPNPDCPECRGDGEGGVHVKDTRDMSEAARAAYAGVRVTKDGVEIKMHDAMRATELLGKHFGMLTENVKHSGHVTITALAARMRNREPLA